MGVESHDKTAVATVLLVAKDNWVNRTQLNKICFFCDVVAEFELGATVTPFVYRKLDFGPVPVGIDLIRNDLVQGELLSTKTEHSQHYSEHSYKANNGVNWNYVSSVLGHQKVEIVRLTVQKLINYTASTLSRYSHDFEPWKSADWYSDMSLSTVKSDKTLHGWLVSVGLVKVR